MTVNKCGFLKKLVGLICVLTLLAGALYVPFTFGASAAAIPVTEDQTVLFTFSDEEGSVKNTSDPNNLTRGDDGMGCVGWGPGIYTGTTYPQRYNTLSVKHTNPVNWADAGGYRLNNNDGVYTLEPSSTYVVSFKFKMVSVPLNTSAITSPKINYLNLGYGFTGGTTGNTCSGMNTVVSKIFTADSVQDTKKNEANYTLTTMMGDVSTKVSDEWIELTYVFATPADLGKGSPALGFYSSNNYGVEYYIDDVAVTKVAANKGTVLLIDEYSDSFSYLTGEIDTVAALPTPEANDPAHEFKGWFYDEGRTNSAEGLKFTKGVATLYSAWKAPVSVTFIDTLNGGEPYVVTGVAGEEIVYPEDPVDGVNDPDQKWFMGWYTTESYTEEFTAKEFGYSNLTVYAKWEGEIADQTENFENYTQDTRTTQTTADGIRYANRFVFGVAMEKKDDFTDEGRGKIAGLNWRGGITLDPNDPSTYKSHERYTSALDNVIVLNSLSLTKGTTYTLSFDYYAENMTETQKVSIFPYVTSGGSVWGGNSVNYRTTQGAEVVVTKGDIDGSWHKGEMTFTANFAVDTAKTLYLLFEIIENTDTVVYIDNVTLSAVQPYESMVIYKHNNGQEDKIVRGNRGEAISKYIPTFREFEFKGWYTDEALTVPFTQETFGRETVVVYAKWPPLPITFEDYKWAYKTEANDRFRFGSRMNIINEEGIGVDGDDYLLDFKLVGDDVKEVAADGKTTYWRERATSCKDHIAQLGTVENGKVYKVTYYYRAMSDNNQELLISLGNGNGTTIWGGASYTYYNNTEQRVAKDNTEWTKAETYISSYFESQYSNTLYLQVCTTAAASTEGMVLHLQIDNVLVERIEAPYVYFDGMNNLTGTLLTGEVGEEIKVPAAPKKFGYDFVGWYTDREFTTPFEATHFAENDQIIAYAKYVEASVVTYTFEDYKYAYRSQANDRFRFGSRMNIINQDGIGVDGDDYLLDFKLVGDDVKEVTADGKTTYWRERATSSKDHIAQLGTVENGKVYKITYYYRAMSDNNQELAITFANGNGSSIWGGAYTNYANTKQLIAKNNTKWTKAETYISTSFDSQYSNVLFLQVCTTASTSTEGMVLHLQVDNVSIERIDAPYVYFDGMNNSYTKIVRGKAGDTIKLPENPTLLGKNFVGWYMDKEFTTPFTLKTFKGDEAITVYAKYELADYVLYDFEDYNLANNPGWYVYGNGGGVKHDLSDAYSGNSAVVLDRDTSNPKYFYASYAAVGYGNGRDIFAVEPNRVYVLTYKYYIAKSATKAAKLSFSAAHSTSFHHNPTTLGTALSIPISKEVGVWHEGTIIVDGTKLKDPTCNYLFVGMTGGNDGLYYIDDVALTRLPEGHTAYIVDNGGCKNVPSYVSGPIGSSFASRLPKEPKYDNHHFGGYSYYDVNNNLATLEREKMVFSEDTIRIVANFVRIETMQDFEKGYTELLNSYGDYTTIDFDYEHYDATKDGNSKDNVTSGKYSLHRKGKTMYFENAQLLTQDKTLTINERYTVTMKVKLGKSFHTDGAIKIASNNNAFYPWATTGDYLAIAAISDLKQGEWTDVSFTYIAAEPYITIQTPGYCELFIDDVKITRVDSSVPTTKAVTFTEYVPAKRDANGNLVDASVWEAEVFKLVDGAAKQNDNYMLFIIIGGAAVLVIAAAVVLLIVIKKRKNKKV